MSMIKLNEENFENMVEKANRPVLVDFSAPWCTYCRRLEPVLDRLSKDWEGVVNIGQVDTDRSPSLAQRFGVTALPTLYLFHNGTHGHALTGPGSQSEIVEWVDNQVNR